MLLMTHRQAWCWQDEYTGLTIEDIRQLEIEAQQLLEFKMNNEVYDDKNRTSSKSDIFVNHHSKSKFLPSLFVHGLAFNSLF